MKDAETIEKKTKEKKKDKKKSEKKDKKSESDTGVDAGAATESHSEVKDKKKDKKKRKSEEIETGDTADSKPKKAGHQYPKNRLFHLLRAEINCYLCLCCRQKPLTKKILRCLDQRRRKRRKRRRNKNR